MFYNIEAQLFLMTNDNGLSLIVLDKLVVANIIP